jgi:uncharacterized protein YbjT (DUF2867 family)
LCDRATRCGYSTIIPAAPCRRLRELERDIEFVNGDIRDAAAVVRGIQGAHHLAFVNGTGTFYSAPPVLDRVDISFASALPVRYSLENSFGA